MATLRVGELPVGPRDAITDVAGVRVGHATIADGAIQTGVTVIVPSGGNLFLEKVPAAACVLNGFGKTVGLMQVEELGTLETPIALTNTFSVGAVATALVRRAVRETSAIGRAMSTVNAVVGECNDGYLNDLHAFAVAPGHVNAACDDAAEEFSRGSVGAGRGMSCFGLKGAIGSASRRVPCENGAWTLGALVLANFGRIDQLILSGRRVGKTLATRIAGRRAEAERGSIIVVLATDAPVDARQLKRVAMRSAAGIARIGGNFGHGSGDIAIAFSTAHRIEDGAEPAIATRPLLAEPLLDPFFDATAEATEQAIVDALFSATTVTGRDGHTRYSLLDVAPDWRELLG
jgi:D-aminopeptidase